jgi:serine/threonine protein phosphatase PrpC
MDHRIISRELAHLTRLSPAMAIYRAELRALLDRLVEHEKAEKAAEPPPAPRPRPPSAPEPSRSLVGLQAAAASESPWSVSEDLVFVDAPSGLVAVVDGEGGAGVGDVAAQVALEVLARHAAALAARKAEGAGPDRREVAERLEALVGDVHDEVAAHARALARTDMCAGLTVAIVGKDRAHFANVGPGRAWLLRRVRLRRLTGEGSIGRLGIPGAGFDGDLSEVELADGDVLLLATEGLLRVVDPDGLRDGLDRATPELAVKHLLKVARDAGLPADASAVVVHVGAPRGAEHADRVAEALAGAVLFRDLDEAERTAVASYLEPKVLAAHEVLFLVGEPGDRAYVVAEGRVRVHVDGTDLIQLGPGSHLGELCLIKPAVRSATVEALEPSLVYGLSREDFRRLCARHPRVGQRIALSLVDFLGERLRDLTERVHHDRKARELRRRLRD